MSLIKKAFYFLGRTISGFRANQGMLLAGAIAYYTLLSIIPLFTLAIVALSHLIDEQELLTLVQNNLSLLFGNQAYNVTQQMHIFLENRQTVGWIGLIILGFFSSMAFTVLENAMSVIFFHRVKIHRRHFLISAIIPYLYIVASGICIFFLAILSGALDMLHGEEVTVFMWSWQMDNVTSTILYIVGLAALTLLLTSFYVVMPVGKIPLKHAFVGSFCVALLWEFTRHGMIWYFSTLSVVNIIYGSLTTTIIALIFLEVAAIILLFGAQALAEYERMDVEPETEGLHTD